MQQTKVLYNTSFLLRPKTTVRNADELELLFHAVRKKLWPHLGRIPSEFAFDDELQSAFQSFVTKREWNARFRGPNSLGTEIESSCARFGDDMLHAIRRFRMIEYPGLKGRSDRTEVTDIGLQTDWKHQCIRFSFNSEMRYSPFAGFGEQDPKELLRMPLEVVAVLETEGLVCDLVLDGSKPDMSGVPHYGATFDPFLVSDVTTARLLADVVMDKHRPVCLVIYFGHTKRAMKEAKIIAKAGALKSHVYVLETRDEVLAPIRKALPTWDIDRDVKERSCRVIFPFPDYDSSDGANPRFRMAWPRRMSTRDRLTRITKGLLRYFPQEDREGLLGMRDMRRRLIRADAKDNKEYAEEAEKIADESERLAKEKEADAEEARSTCRELRQTIEELELKLEIAQQDKAELEGANESLRKVCADQGTLLAKRGVKAKDIPTLPEEPPVFHDLVEVLGYAEKHLNNLKILKSAYSHAKSLDRRNPSEGYWMLRDMNDILFSLFQKGGTEIDDEFNSRSHFSCVSSEGSQTRADRKIKRERTILENGKPFVFWAHVRSKTRGEDCLIRAYYCYDQETQKILIGFFGKHLRTAGTERMDT